MHRPPLHEALARRETVLRSFLDDDGRIRQMPARLGKRLVILDHVSHAFEIGRRYQEVEVNVILRAFFDDYAALRRYLVEEGFLSREAGVYWRSGGTVDLTDTPEATDGGSS
ncbi:MAG: DUF2087 domain-containing protein [Actinomycetes bacterium]